MDQNVQIVGIGGLPRSGKDTLAELFISHNYYGFSFGDYLRSYSRERHKDKPDPISIANMTETSNWLRDTHGPDVILQAALKEFNEQQKQGNHYKGLVLYSVRAPVEADWILAHNGQLIWVETDEGVRYERNVQDIRPGEAKISFEEFKRQEALQWQPQTGVSAEVQMDLSYIKQKSTINLVNNGNNIEDFKDVAIKELSKLL